MILEGEDITGLSVSQRAKKGISLAWQEPATYLDRDIDNTLSGGERKRIEMASILAILDEPDSGIDILSLPFLLSAILEMNKQGSSVLLITHNERVVEIAHSVSVLCAGRILRTGEPREMSLWVKENCQPCAHVNEPEKESDKL
jgi:Fe-S cluster assembly ATP-binding protein